MLNRGLRNTPLRNFWDAGAIPVRLSGAEVVSVLIGAGRTRRGEPCVAASAVVKLQRGMIRALRLSIPECRTRPPVLVKCVASCGLPGRGDIEPR